MDVILKPGLKEMKAVYFGKRKTKREYQYLKVLWTNKLLEVIFGKELPEQTENSNF